MVDSTWQQLLVEGLIRPEMPKVLIGTPDEAVEYARSYGMESYKLDAYRL